MNEPKGERSWNHWPHLQLAAPRGRSDAAANGGRETRVKTHVPSLRAQTYDDERLREDLALFAVRQQVAIVRAFADELKRLTSREGTRGLCEQFVEELARLGCRILETAATASRTMEPPTPMVTRRPISQYHEGSPHSPGTPKREFGLRVVATPSEEMFR
jgi:hypothetical protein